MLALDGAADRRARSTRASANDARRRARRQRRTARPTSASCVTRGIGELTYDPAAMPDAVGRRHRQAERRSAARGVRARRQGRRSCRSCATIPGTVNPLIKSNNLLNNALAMQEAFRRGGFEGVMRNYKRRARRVHAVEPVHRQGRRGADAAARRRACCPASRASSCSRSAPRPASRCAKRCCTTTICSAPTKRSSPAPRARSCRSCRSTIATIGSGRARAGDARAARRLPPQGAVADPPATDGSVTRRRFCDDDIGR